MDETTTFTHYALQYRYQWRDQPVMWTRLASGFPTIEAARREAHHFNAQRRRQGLDPYTLRIVRSVETTEVVGNLQEDA